MIHVTESKAWHKGFGGDRFKSLTVGDRTYHVVELFEGLFVARCYDGGRCERVSQRERNHQPGHWSSKRAAVARCVEHAYEHTCDPLTRKVAAEWLTATNRGAL